MRRSRVEGDGSSVDRLGASGNPFHSGSAPAQHAADHEGSDEEGGSSGDADDVEARVGGNADRVRDAAGGEERAEFRSSAPARGL